MLLALAMPQFGESITHSRIMRWLKKEGEVLQELEPLVEMETEKAVFAYESPFRGKLTKILAKEDEEVPVGTEIAQFEVTEEDGKRYLSLGVGRAVESGAPEAVRPAVRKGVSPLIRSLAKEHNVPLEELEKWAGSGPGGRLTQSDFFDYLKKRGASQGPAAKTGVRTLPVSAIRSRIAQNMVLSKQRIPHAGCSVDVDLEAIERWRKGQKGAPGYLPFAAVAALKALREHPILNSSFHDEGGRRWIEQYDAVHLGIAVATDQGLMVPVLRNAQDLSFAEIRSEIERLVEGGRKGVLKVEELTGATFTINNSGAVGAMRSQQIIPYPQAAVLAINRVVRRPWVVGEKIEIRPVMGLDLAFDHRVLDGDQATRFLVAVRENLEKFDPKILRPAAS